MRALTLLTLMLALPAFAMPVKTKLIRTRAYTKVAGNGLYQVLDLKAKTLRMPFS